MVIQFTVKNFRSFKDEATLSLVAEPLRDKVTTLLTRDRTRLLPVAGIFGPNASGKSNFNKAFSFMHMAITIANNMNFPPTQHPMFQPFLLDPLSRDEPSLFEIILWDEPKKTEYRYGFEINKQRIVSEWLELQQKSNKNYSSKLIFERKFDKFNIGPGYKKNLSLLTDKVLPNILAVSVFAQFANEPSLGLVNLMKNTAMFDGVHDVANLSLQNLYDQPELLKKVVNFLQNADIAIKDIEINKIEQQVPMHRVIQGQTVSGATNGFPSMRVEGFEVQTTHSINNAKNDYIAFNLLEHESFGTQRLFGFAALLFRMLDSGGTLVVDEFGASMHPFISKAIIKVLQNKETNPKHAQLVFCSHDTYLLSDEVGLRRDQVWFTDKNKQEQTVLHSLSEYKTRADLKIAKNYLEGRFGAVPVTRFK